jgi:hypothetical protein
MQPVRHIANNNRKRAWTIRVKNSNNNNTHLQVLRAGFASLLVLAGLAIKVASATTSPSVTGPPAAGARATTGPEAKHAIQQKKGGPHHPSRYSAGAMPASARNFYTSTWGVDSLSTQLAESGQLVRFSYRIANAGLAKPLLDKVSNPSLLDEHAHAVLSVPTMEKVGPLRQSGAVEAGKTYWVLFSNRGNVVRAGDKVSVVIGSFRVDGLIVEK